MERNAISAKTENLQKLVEKLDANQSSLQKLVEKLDESQSRSQRNEANISKRMLDVTKMVTENTKSFAEPANFLKTVYKGCSNSPMTPPADNVFKQYLKKN